MKVYGSFVKHYEIEVEVPDDATIADIYDAVKDEIELLEDVNILEESEVDDYIESITDENYNIVWES